MLMRMRDVLFYSQEDLRVDGIQTCSLQVYKGEDCLNSVQISALLTVDTKRALDRAANSVASLDDQCCEVMAVFGDIQHSTGK
jgi:glycerol-3-phosphate responsive antiterminator